MRFRAATARGSEARGRFLAPADPSPCRPPAPGRRRTLGLPPPQQHGGEVKLPPPPSSPSAEQVVWQRERFPSAGGRPQGRAEGGGSCPAPPLRQPGRLPRPRREGCPVSPMQGGGCAAGGGVISMLGSARTFSWGGGTGLHPPLLSGRVSPPLAQPRGTCGPPPSGGGCPQRAAPPPAPAPVLGAAGAAPAPRPLAHLQTLHAGRAGARTGGRGGRSAAPGKGHVGPRGGPLGGACPLPGAAS